MTPSCIVRRTSPDGSPCGEPVHVTPGSLRQDLSSEQVETLRSAGYHVQVKSFSSLGILPFAEEFLATYGVESPHAAEF